MTYEGHIQSQLIRDFQSASVPLCYAIYTFVVSLSRHKHQLLVESCEFFILHPYKIEGYSCATYAEMFGVAYCNRPRSRLL